MNNELVVKNIRTALKDYLIRHNLKSMIVGLSGGIDSTVSCALAEPVCKELGVKLIGRSLPILTNKMDEIERARIVGDAFCDDFREVDLGGMFHELNNFIEDEEGAHADGTRDKIRQGNIKARLRMVYLYNLAFMKEGLVLSNDNLTELYLGFWTLHGDVGDLGMIQNLWKTEVYSVATYLKIVYSESIFDGNDIKQRALNLCISATPTDGLGITSSDLEQIGAPTYMEVDKILQGYINHGDKIMKDHPVIKRYESSHFKRNNPFNFSRETLFDGNE